MHFHTHVTTDPNLSLVHERVHSALDLHAATPLQRKTPIRNNTLMPAPVPGACAHLQTLTCRRRGWALGAHRRAPGRPKLWEVSLVHVSSPSPRRGLCLPDNPLRGAAGPGGTGSPEFAIDFAHIRTGSSESGLGRSAGGPESRRPAARSSESTEVAQDEGLLRGADDPPARIWPCWAVGVRGQHRPPCVNLGSEAAPRSAGVTPGSLDPRCLAGVRAAASLSVGCSPSPCASLTPARVGAQGLAEERGTGSRAARAAGAGPREAAEVTLGQADPLATASCPSAPHFLPETLLALPDGVF